MGSGCVAQLVERSLLIPEVRGLNPVISKYLFILNISLLSTVYWKDKNKEKRGRVWPIFIKNYLDAWVRSGDAGSDPLYQLSHNNRLCQFYCKKNFYFFHVTIEIRLVLDSNVYFQLNLFN